MVEHIVWIMEPVEEMMSEHGIARCLSVMKERNVLIHPSVSRFALQRMRMMQQECVLDTITLDVTFGRWATEKQTRHA